jgi:predicted GIY-YIG superfamily endonuclease
MTARVGTVYLLHFTEPYQHARHYLGWAEDVEARLADHAAGRGARLLAVVQSAGIDWRLARTWEGTRARERQIKRQGGLSRSCPLCGVRPASTADRVAVAALPARFPRFASVFGAVCLPRPVVTVVPVGGVL